MPESSGLEAMLSFAEDISDVLDSWEGSGRVSLLETVDGVVGIVCGRMRSAGYDSGEIVRHLEKLTLMIAATIELEEKPAGELN